MIERMLGRPATLIDSPAGPHVHWSGGGEPKVLLLGHHDTVFPLGALAARPFTVADGHVTGPGVFDMLAGIVQALHGLATLDDLSGVELLFSADEEVGSVHSRELIEERARACGAVLVLEPSADGGALKTGRKGCGTFEVVVERAGVARRARTREGRQRARRGGPSGAGDQHDRSTRRRHHGHADGRRRRHRRQRGPRTGPYQGRRARRVGRREGSGRGGDGGAGARSIPTRRSRCPERSTVRRCPSRRRCR